jgi:hypothetical protein
LVSILSSVSYLPDESFTNTVIEVGDRLLAAAVSAGCFFTAKSVIWVREEMAMRQVAFFLAHFLSLNWSDRSGAKQRFFYRIVKSPYDIIELLVLGGGRPASHAERVGLATRLVRFSFNELALATRKLDMAVNIYDAINVLHAHSHAIAKLKNCVVNLGGNQESSSFDLDENAIATKQAWLEKLNSGTGLAIEFIDALEV